MPNLNEKQMKQLEAEIVRLAEEQTELARVHQEIKEAAARRDKSYEQENESVPKP